MHGSHGRQAGNACGVPSSNTGWDCSLLQLIKMLLCMFEECCKLADALSDVKEKFCAFKQGEFASLQHCHELLMVQVQVLKEVGVTIADQALAITVVSANGRPNAPNNNDHDKAKQIALAVKFIWSTDGHHQAHLRHFCNQ